MIVKRKPLHIPIYNPYINYLYSPVKPVSPPDRLYTFYCENPRQRLSRWASLLAQLFRPWTGKPV